MPRRIVLAVSMSGAILSGCAIPEGLDPVNFPGVAYSDSDVHSRSLPGIFGVAFGETYSMVKEVCEKTGKLEPGTADGLDGYRLVFSPKRQFRGFERYFAVLKDGRVVNISAVCRMSDFKTADAEFKGIVGDLDSRYSAVRRKRVKSKDESHLEVWRYSFDDDSIHGDLQTITLTMSFDGLVYEISILAVDEALSRPKVLSF